MGRKKRVVNKADLESLLRKLESEREYQNRSELYKAVCETEWGRGLKLSPSVVYLRVNEFNLDLKTPIGKRGNMNLGSVTRTRKQKVAPDKVVKALTKELKYLGVENLVPRILGGSLKAVIKAQCLVCSESKKDIKNCNVFGCPLWFHRPYQSTESELEDEV